jgi:hypothetical protein
VHGCFPLAVDFRRLIRPCRQVLTFDNTFFRGRDTPLQPCMSRGRRMYEPWTSNPSHVVCIRLRTAFYLAVSWARVREHASKPNEVKSRACHVARAVTAELKPSSSRSRT